MQGLSNRSVSTAGSGCPIGRPHNNACTRPALRAVLISGALMFVASAVVMVSLHRPARAGEADRYAAQMYQSQLPN